MHAVRASRGSILRTGVLIALMSLGVPAPAADAAAGRDANWRVLIRDFAAQHFKHPAWGYSHCVRDYALAKDLAAA